MSNFLRIECPGCSCLPLEVSQAHPSVPEVLIGCCPACGALYLLGEQPIGGKTVVLGRAGLMVPGVRMVSLDGRQVGVAELVEGEWTVPEGAVSEGRLSAAG